MRRRLQPSILENIRLLRSVIRRPKEVSTIFPTSLALSQALLARTGVEVAKLVVELGPGGGAITRPLLTRLRANTEYVGVEIHDYLVKVLRSEFPKLRIVRDSAENLVTILDGRKADAIVSSIPWTLLGSEIQERILSAVVSSLKPDGTFSTYVCANTAWLPSARRLKELLSEEFEEVEKSRMVWTNVPPAFVYTCRKPRLHSRKKASSDSLRAKKQPNRAQA